MVKLDLTDLRPVHAFHLATPLGWTGVRRRWAAGMSTSAIRYLRWVAS